MVKDNKQIANNNRAFNLNDAFVVCVLYFDFLKQLYV
jgi:hypothetical protein